MSLEQTLVDSSSQLLTCTICLEAYDDVERLPKLLSCHHSFCLTCLTTLSTANKLKTLGCPACREKTVLPAGGITKLQTNFYISQVKEVIDKRVEKLPNCQRHSKALDHFCATCERSICADCQQQDHPGHSVKPVAEAIEVQRRLLQSEISSVWPLLLATNKIQKAAETGVRFLLASKHQAEEAIQTTFATIEESLRKRKAQLEAELHEAYECRKEILVTRLEEAKKASATIVGLADTCRLALASSSIDGLVAHRVKLVCKTREMQSEDKTAIGPHINCVSFRTDNVDNLISSVGGIGSCVTENPIPNSATVKESDAVACRISTISFAITDFNNVELKEFYPLEVEVTDVYDDVISCRLEHSQNGLYTVTFQPQTSGPHHLSIRFWHHVITSCCILVESNDPVQVYGGKETEQGPDKMQYPRDVAVNDSTGNIYVVDSGNSRVVAYDNQGTQLLEFPISTSEDDVSSCSLAIDQNRGTVICSEVIFDGSDPVESRSILKYTADGKLLARMSLWNFLKQGLSLAVNSLGQTVIADAEQDAIFVFDAQGRFLKRFGESGIGPSQFKRPTFICVGKDDSIIVTDSDNSRIQVFDRTGRFSYSFGERGTRKGQFIFPFGVTADRFGNILVVDGANNRVQVFKKGGKFVGCIESLGDKMNAPRGIDVTSDGHVFVADRDNHCVKKFKYL